MSLGAVVLTGGASRRMGSDKAALEWHGVRAVDRVVDLARNVGARSVVVSGVSGYGYPFVGDGVPLSGPCGGIVRSIGVLKQGGCSRALILAVDAPTIRPKDIEPLLEHPAPGAFYEGLHLPFVVTTAACPQSPAGWPVARFIAEAGLASLKAPAHGIRRLRGANSPEERAVMMQELTLYEPRSRPSSSGV